MKLSDSAKMTGASLSTVAWQWVGFKANQTRVSTSISRFLPAGPKGFGLLDKLLAQGSLESDSKPTRIERTGEWSMTPRSSRQVSEPRETPSSCYPIVGSS